MIERYKASPVLEQFLISRCGPHFVCGSQKCEINSLEELEAFKRKHGPHWHNEPIPVFPYAADSPFTEKGDAAYQAWHDREHAAGGFTFDLAGETELALKHFNDCIRAGLCCDDALALFFMVRSRVAYMERHGGKNPPDRAKFLMACFLYGEDCAVSGDYDSQYAGYTCK